MFDKLLYIEEMKKMVDKAIERLQEEKSHFKIYTTSIWTDPNAAVSSIGFDSKENSLKVVEESNEWNRKYYEQYLAEGDLKMAELFKPAEITRICNPANYDLRDFEETTHKSFLKNWEKTSNGKCWPQLVASLSEIGEYAFQKIKSLNVEHGFELSINSDKDWYDKTWS